MIKMKVRRYIHNSQYLLKQGEEIVKQNTDPKIIHQVTMVNLVLSEMRTKDLSEYCGDSIRAINIWVKKVDELWILSGMDQPCLSI